MKITKGQLRKIIREEAEAINENVARMPEIHFEWSRGGLEMMMMADGVEILRFSNQKEVEKLIQELKGLLDGPMRYSS